MNWWNSSWTTDHFFNLAVFLTMLFLVLSLLRSKRPPGNALAWIFAVVLLPYVGIPLYLLFGTRKIKSRKKIAWLQAGIKHDFSHLRPLERVLMCLGVSPALSNRKIEIIETGQQAYLELIQEIENAKTSIDLMTFIFARDKVGRLILEKLIARARSGVRVRVMVDAWGSSIFVRPSFRALIQAGGEVAFSLPIIHRPSAGRTNLRNHRKLALFDRKIAIFGGMNLTREYLGPEEDEDRWVDLCLRLEGDSLPLLNEIFDGDWKISKHLPLPEMTATLTEKVPEQNHVTQVVASGPDIEGDPLYDGLLSICFEAQRRIWITTPYFVPDETLIKALVLACRRGVDVRLLIPQRSNHFFADLCRGSYVRQLRKAGAGIYMLPKMTHAKLVVADDDLAMVGSANFDLRSLLYNYELGVFLYSKTEVSPLIEWFESRFQQAVLSKPEKPNLIRETIEGAVRIFGPLF